MPARSPASIAKLVGLLIIGILFLGCIGLFGTTFSHDEGQKALSEAIESSTLLDQARVAQATFKIQVQDWKNYLLRGHDAADHDKYVAQFSAAETAVDLSLEKVLSSDFLSQDLRGEVESIRAEHARLGGVYREAMKKFEPARADSTFEVDASVRGIDQELTQRIDAVAEKILASAIARASELKQQFDSRYHMLRNLVGGGTLVVLVLLGIVVWRARIVR